MNGALLCAATLAARVRCRLDGVLPEDEPLLPAHPAFLVLHRMSYAVKTGEVERVVATDAEQWLRWLHERGLSRVRLDPAARRAAVLVTVDAGTLAWTPEGGRLVGREGRAVNGGHELGPLASQLAREIARATTEEPDPVRRASLERAILILDSEDDGEEVADTAWPHFILPAAEVPDRRRVVAAAATVLPQEDMGQEPERPDSKLVAVALAALGAAVNGD